MPMRRFRTPKMPDPIVKGSYSFRISRPKYDRYVLEEIWDKDVYGIDHLPDHLEGVIIDVGAHIGGFAGRVRQKWPECTIFAFEPHPKNARLFRKNARSNGWQKIHFFAKAITKETQTVALHLDPQNSAGHSLLDPGGRHQVSVPGISIEDMIRQEKIGEIGLMKLDCEGSEYDILENISPHTLNRIHYLLVEWHPIPHQHRGPLEERLLRAGFRTLREQPDPYVPNQHLTAYERSK